MHRFKASDLRKYLRAVDRNLSTPFQLVIIGGSAALLGYGVRRVTKDIDTLNPEFRKIQSALDAAREETGLDIPIQYPGIEDGPYNLEDRLQVITISGLEKLGILVPEKHDLVLMKMIRGEEPDLEVAEEIHEKRGLGQDILISRYLAEMKHIHGDIRLIDLNFLALMNRLFGAEPADSAEQRIKRQRMLHP